MKSNDRKTVTSLKTYLRYNIRTGAIKYLDMKSLENKISVISETYPFQKDKAYRHENEFRLFLEKSGMFAYDAEQKCYVLQTDDAPLVDFLQGNPKDFLTNVYEYNRTTGKLAKKIIPVMRKETQKPPLREVSST